MENAVIQLLVLAGIAIFLILRLKSVLGTREGFEKPPVPLDTPEPHSARRSFEVIEGGADPDITDHVPEGSPQARALAAMKAAEPSFGVGDFLQGARAAYEMILMAFEKGEMERVRPFLSPEVFDAFSGVVRAREEQGLSVHAEFLGLRELVLEDATFDATAREAELTVRFGGELISVARDAAGQIVEGDPKAARKQRDIWTFARKMGSNDPNWQLVATGG
ncbi:MAG: Tim44 domain-containing protein [Rhodobacteraceae bacterium]|nr:Tim44 domain-containing protein [Paracoccaceae bacterium]